MLRPSPSAGPSPRTTSWPASSGSADAPSACTPNVNRNFRDGTLVLLRQFGPAIRYMADGGGADKAAGGGRGAVHGLSGGDRGGAGGREAGRLGAGLLHGSAAAGRAQERRAGGGPDGARPGAGQAQIGRAHG